MFWRRKLLVGTLLIALCRTAIAYGPTGHEIVGGTADKLIANTPAAKKIYALTDGITLERASTMADEIKAWDKNGVDDLSAFPHYAEHGKLDAQLREFWRANPPTLDSASSVPSHHWFHYTDVPVLNVGKYSNGKTGRTQWDIVHMIAYCVDVLRGEVPESNSRKITKSVAVILLAHYAGDIHQPLHVGAEYFNRAGQAVDPDKGQAGLEDEGGNMLFLRLIHGRPEDTGKRGLKLHGFWDNEAVLANLPPVPADLSREERFKFVEPSKRKIVEQFAREEPKNWRPPANIALKNYGEFWADDILPIAREAHERLQFINVHETIDQERTVAAGDAREKNAPDRVGYEDWSAGVVRIELQKAGWRLADLLTQAIEGKSAGSDATVPSSESVLTAPEKGGPVPATVPKQAEISTPSATGAAKTAASVNDSSGSAFGAYPANYKEIVTQWMQKNSIDSSRVEWQGEPKPADMPVENGRRVSGYLVIFNTPDRAGMKTRSVLIRDGAIVSNNGF